VELFSLNWVGDFSYDELEFEHVDEFPIEYESLRMDGGPKCNVFNFNDVTPATPRASDANDFLIPM